MHIPGFTEEDIRDENKLQIILDIALIVLGAIALDIHLAS